MARGGFAVVAPHIRGRGGNPGTADDSARELQDIVDAIDAAVAAQPSKLDPTRVFVVGYSGGGANAIALAAKYPGRFIAIFSFFGWGDYGVNTMGNAFETTSAVSYWGSKDSPGVLAARIGPRSDLLAYRARNVHPMIGAAISQASTKLLMFWAPTDPIGNCLRKVRDTLIDCGAPLTRWYAEADAKWAHGYPDTNPLLIDAEAPLRRMVNDPAPTTRLSGTIEISGHCVHGNVNGDGWRLWTADPESADAELDPAGGRRHRVRCTFDTTTMQYLVSPLSGACTVTIKQTVLAPLTDSINGHAHGVRIVTKLVDTADTPFDLANGLLTIVPDALHCYEAEVGIAKSGASILSWTGRDGKGGPAVPVAAVPTYSAANPYHPAVLFAQSGNDRLRADGSPLLSGTESFGIACRFSGTAGNGMMAGCSYSDVLGVSNQWIAIIGDDAHFYGAISTSLGDITLTFSGYGYTTLNPNLVILERVGTTLWLTVGDEATVSVTNAFIGGTITATRLNIGELDRSAGFSELYPLAGSVSHLMSVVGRRFTNPERRELWRYTRSLGVVS
jgi:pimeloyl-ACP methyl ester carboxylesterase